MIYFGVKKILSDFLDGWVRSALAIAEGIVILAGGLICLVGVTLLFVTYPVWGAVFWIILRILGKQKAAELYLRINAWQHKDIGEDR